MKKWCVAVSGGCDSMTLLDMCIQNKIDIMVAHVNYHKRESAKRDENIVKAYCKAHNVVCLVSNYQDQPGNFQAAARDFRYAFFKQIVEDYNCEGVLVAHQMDDVLETYELQKKRSVPSVYGLASDAQINGLRIVRPLLMMSKQACYEYCEERKIAFGEDESNQSEDYTRNRIRKEINCWSETKKNAVLTEIQTFNEKKHFLDKMLDHQVQSFKDKLPVEKVNDELLRYWLNKQLVGFNLSEKYIHEIVTSIKATHTQHYAINEQVELVCAYGYLELVPLIGYSYTFEKQVDFKCPYFEVSKQGSRVEAVTLSEADFPITIRSYQKGDAIRLRYGNKKINRFFIDRKISHKERKLWPIVVNGMGNVILVPKIGCDIEHFTNKPNCFVLK